MAGSLSEDYGVGRSLASEGISSGHLCRSGEVLAEWRSSEQVENGCTSTSPPYWDTDDDDDDDDSGPKPSDLYGKFTWKIENFSQISKRELRSNAFEVGSYKWYILIYPQGCDVCNHLSLFLCVANHDKLLPGWSHFAQFTIAVVNKDPKKSKYSDTLHRFWKKEHDWGWKKFMELSKVLDGFIVNDTLIIKAQVQVIREKSHRPFRCLDCQYRRELVRVYLTNVEQICRRFVEERRGKLCKLIEDKTRWSSFCAFWLGVDQNSRRRMSREKSDVILKVLVKHFFIEKEVTSTLVMDSLYSGLKALECQSKSKKRRAKLMDTEETPDPIVRAEKDMFILADDVLLLLERAALEPLPPKDEKGPQNRTKDGNSGEDFNKDSIERDERRLTELGRRTVEIFILAHIFSNIIEVAYQEAVALKRQEELIREEEAAGQAEIEQKARRAAAEKEKRAKKKQSKQRRSGRKSSDKGRDEKADMAEQVKQQLENPIDLATTDNFSAKQGSAILEKPEVVEDVSDLSYTGDDVMETLNPDLEDRDASPINWDTDTSEVNPATEASSSSMSDLPSQNGRARKNSSSVVDDSSSTCSTDSAPSTNGLYKGNPSSNYRSLASPDRGKNQHSNQADWVPESHNQSSGSVADIGRLQDTSGTCRATGPESEAVDISLKDQRRSLKEHLIQKEEVPMPQKEEAPMPQKKLIVNDQANAKKSSKQKITVEASSSPSSLIRNLLSPVQPKSTAERIAPSEPFSVKETSSNSFQKTEKQVHLKTSSLQSPAVARVEPLKADQKPATPLKPTSLKVENPTQVPGISRPSSAPLMPGPRPSVPIVSMTQTIPLLARSSSASGQLANEPSAGTHSYAPQSYRNAIMGKTLTPNSASFVPRSSTSAAGPSSGYALPFSGPPSSPTISPQSSGRKDQSTLRSGFTFGSVTPEILQNQPRWLDEQADANRHYDHSVLNGIQNLNICSSSGSGPYMYIADQFPASVSTRQTQGVAPDEFPHLDIINYLLDDEQNTGRGSMTLNPYSGHQDRLLNRQFTFPGDMDLSADAGPSMNYSRLSRMECYHGDRMHHVYGSSSGHFDGSRDVDPPAGLSSYGNGHLMDEVIQNQWPVGGADLSMLSHTDGYFYQLPEYSNLARGVNGYGGMFHPSNER